MNLFFLKKLITLKSTVFNIDQFNLFIICGKSQNSGIWIPSLLTFLVSCWDFPVEELLWKEAHAFIQLISSEIRLTHMRLCPKTAFLFVFSMSLLYIFVQNLSGFLAKIQFFFFCSQAWVELPWTYFLGVEKEPGLERPGLLGRTQSVSRKFCPGGVVSSQEKTSL